MPVLIFTFYIPIIFLSVAGCVAKIPTQRMAWTSGTKGSIFTSVLSTGGTEVFFSSDKDTHCCIHSLPEAYRLVTAKESGGAVLRLSHPRKIKKYSNCRLTRFSAGLNRVFFGFMIINLI